MLLAICHSASGDRALGGMLTAHRRRNHETGFATGRECGYARTDCAAFSLGL
jgi:hypothetical protein